MSVEPVEKYPCYVKVCEEEGGDVIELPTETSGKLVLSTIQSQFNTAIGMKYKTESGTWRGVANSGEHLEPPFEGWGDKMFYITFAKDSVKRKLEESPNREPEAKLVKTTTNDEANTDLIVLGLPYKADNQDLKDYFSMFGELAMYEIKNDPVTKQSRGFAFIRYKNIAVVQKVISQEHTILGRRCEVKMPKKKVTKRVKLFVGRLPSDTSEDELREHFSEFGTLTDVYIPMPYRGFGFITYESGDDAQHVLNITHTIKGTRLNVTTAEPKEKERTPSSSGGRGRESRDSRDSRDRGRFDFEDMRRVMYNPPRDYPSRDLPREMHYKPSYYTPSSPYSSHGISFAMDTNFDNHR